MAAVRPFKINAANSESSSDYAIWPGAGATRLHDLPAHDFVRMIVDAVLGAAKPGAATAPLARSRCLLRPTPASKFPGMSQFVPPYPERPKEPLPLFAMMAAARRNFLAMFDEKCFEYKFFSTRLLARRVVVCNSPDTVAQAFIALH